MRYPKPQKGNPHRLTIDQHIFPKSCIARFAGDKGTVQVRRKSGEKDLWLTPGNSYFCARRLWDQKSEAVFMKAIEDRYQDVARNIVAGAVTTLDAMMNQAVTDLYLLWTLRHERFLNPIPDARINFVAPEREMSIDTQEILEANGYVFAAPDNTIPSRFMTGVRFMMQMRRERERMVGKRWGILTSDEAEFLVPDNFSAFSVLPLSPTIALVEGHAAINLAAIRTCLTRIAMNQSGISALNSLAFVLRALRCFNAAAFAALAFFYFASYSLPPLPSHSLKLIPLAQISH